MSSWIDLSDRIGLPVKVDPNNLQLQFGDGVLEMEHSVRDVREVRPVMLDPFADVFPAELYHMHRGVRLSSDTDKFAARNLRYDITIMRPGTVGPELIKTHGHYHPAVPGTKTFYPEVYEVVYGTAWYLLQKVSDINAPGTRVEDVILVEAKPGDKVVMLPGYGHITINPDPYSVLVMTDFVGSSFSTIFPSVKATVGGAYYFLAPDGEIIANPHYRELPPLRRAVPNHMPALGLQKDVPLYTSGSQDPDRLMWLLDPTRFAGDWLSALSMR
ncbi:MAG: glucose-6-phosphate isomerase family protein [Armatimonadota bacterium]